ncbi:unnamed protein product [Kuraishia capsulata CBS 1993]|uniref:Dilute domain-containing protein n=1 Tax=Kuraishia capsulata CBS 1993 TaxID=1382522 RepID=W6MPT7_9ASCO|nr:uncharacterized protein KUCA_T00003169001 [Kuraishia capsulata CBS 1993]CDK27192.1 unnamed protein product [Kuraishia capsulata CBS 1993]
MSSYFDDSPHTPVDDVQAFYKPSVSPGVDEEDTLLQEKIRLQAASIAALGIKDTSEDNIYKTATFGGQAVHSVSEADMFNFDRVLPKQYIRFYDSNLSEIMDYIFSLYEQHSSQAILPAAVVYQCLRYAESKLESAELVESFLNLFLTRLRAVTNTKSGVMSVETSRMDIVMLSYWLSAVNSLYYYLYRDTACKFFTKYPKILQELATTLQSLITQLAFALNNRLEAFIDPCLLEYSSVPGVKDIIYKSDWHLFRPQKNHKTTYDEVLEMLYPPSIQEQMKPSPLKIIQTLGALMYVLELHHISDVIKQQTFSAVLYWLGATIFNRLLANKAYSSRARSLQIRLNVSTIEDWLRSNDFTPYKPSNIHFSSQDYPESIVGSQIRLQNVARFNNDLKNPLDASFFYNSLFKIGKYHLTPAIELLEFTQVMTTLGDLETLNKTVSSFTAVGPTHLLAVVKNYRYETEETKFAKLLKNDLKALSASGKLKLSHVLFYSGNEDNLFLNASHIFPVALPNLLELLHQHGFGVEAYDPSTAKAFQPMLPLDVVDAIDNIYDQQESRAREYERYGNNTSEDEDEGEDGSKPTGADDSFKGTEMFKEVKMPSGLVHKTWERENEDEINPWA